tara:strand:+ start:356 stop:493 length:138 start_codon:yes stop_codon:yes gene_type:complete
MNLMKNKMVLVLAGLLVIPFLLGLSLSLAEIEPRAAAGAQLADLD